MSHRIFQFRSGAGMIFLSLIAILVCSLAQPAAASAPPVRIAVVQGGGSGQEQEVVDRISNALGESADIALSTVNPDWYVICNIKENLDQMSGQIRYNGTVIIKTVDGQVINTVAVQKYNQDFSLQPGAPLNKALVDGAVRQVIAGLADRAMGPIVQAVAVEMETRNRMVQAAQLAEDRKFQDAIDLLRPISPETPHFAQVRKMIAKFQSQMHPAAAPATKHHR